MPTYEYDCKECGRRAEFFQSMSDAPKRKCPHCGARNGLKRRIGCGAGLIFRGSGFYITDYRSDSYRKQAKQETKTDSPADAKGDGTKGDGAKSEAATAKTAEKATETKQAG
jgi:putative FmdB family regulatory protein